MQINNVKNNIKIIIEFSILLIKSPPKTKTENKSYLLFP